MVELGWLVRFRVIMGALRCVGMGSKRIYQYSITIHEGTYITYVFEPWPRQCKIYSKDSKLGEELKSNEECLLTSKTIRPNHREA